MMLNCNNYSHIHIANSQDYCFILDSINHKPNIYLREKLVLFEENDDEDYEEAAAVHVIKHWAK